MTRRTGLLVATSFVAGLVAAGPVARVAASRLLPNAAYADAAVPSDDKTRALTLFGEVLERVQADYVDSVSTGALIHHALNGMLSGLDPHSGYMDQKQWHEMQLETRGHFGGLGMTVTAAGGLLKVVSPIDGTPAARAGIKPGDLIVSVDGKTLEGLTLEEAVDKLRGAPNSQVSLIIKRTGVDKPIQLTLTREIVHMEAVKSRRDGDIGYIRLTVFNDETDRDLRADLANLRQAGKISGLVIDLRNNPGGLLDQAVAVADDFLDGGEIVSTRGRHNEDNHAWYARAGDLVNGMPIVVLINNGSASASEIVAGALQDNHRALLVGSRSFGKGSVQTLYPLHDDGAIRLTTARYYTPDGRSIQGAGILPDILVRQSDLPEPSFAPEHESDLNNVLGNPNGDINTPRRPMPPVGAGLADKPPPNWPKYDATKPETDFQLHQAEIILQRMITGPARSAPTGQKGPRPAVPRQPA